MRRTFLLAFGAALALAAVAGSRRADAGTLQVDPVLVEIGDVRRTGSVTVRNEGDVPVTIRAYPLAWRREGGEDRYDETADIIVSPPVFTIAPHAIQTVRVGARRPAAAPRSYRLIIEEVPEPAPADSGVRVALRFNLPLYSNLAAGVPADLRWRAYRQADAKACTLTAAGIAFGAYDPRSAAGNGNPGMVNLVCPAGVTAPIAALGGGLSGAVDRREMRSSTGETLQYNLYTTAARTVVWGNGTLGTVSQALSGNSVSGGSRSFSRTIFGRRPGRQNVGPGSYSDMVTLTVTF
jgi:spore coat protein U-like protein